jgi:hypothetical protein
MPVYFLPLWLTRLQNYFPIGSEFSFNLLTIQFASGNRFETTSMSSPR